MVDVPGLKGLIASKNLKQKEVYEKIGMTRRQWCDRLQKRKFDSNEMYDIKNVLGDEVISIFFAD